MDSVESWLQMTRKEYGLCFYTSKQNSIQRVEFQIILLRLRLQDFCAPLRTTNYSFRAFCANISATFSRP
jgi:hypothetical protein